jgi:hypothetical protein
VQGESIYTNPPDKNMAFIDHGIEEDNIWAFPLSFYNSPIVKNEYLVAPDRAFSHSYAPFWGEKLMTPAFYKEDKMKRFMFQWNLKIGLQALKIKQAVIVKNGNEKEI